MDKAAQRFVQRMGAAAAAGEAVDVSAALAELTMEVIGGTAFGVSFEAGSGATAAADTAAAAGMEGSTILAAAKTVRTGALRHGWLQCI